MAMDETETVLRFSKEDALEYALDTGERLRLVSIVGGYRHKQIEGRRIMAELGNPAVILLLLYLLALPGIIMEFFMMKRLWYFGFDLYSVYVFFLASGCIGAGFYLIFRRAESESMTLKKINAKLIFAAIPIAMVCMILLVTFGRDSAVLAILFSIGLIMTAIIIVAASPYIQRRDIFPVALYGAGIVTVALAPIHQAFGIWTEAPGEFTLSSLDWALIVLGISISLVAINAVRSRMGLFACWLLGATVIALVAFHEIAAIQSSGSFEIYDQVLALEGAIFSIAPLTIYFVKERESARIWSHLLNAVRALDRRGYERAIKETEKAFGILSSFGQANRYGLPWAIYGDIYYRMGKFNRARTFYDMALSIDRNDIETLSNLGNMLAFKGFGERALSTYRNAVRIAPHDSKIWNNIGVVFLSMRRYDEALAAFNKSINEDNSFASAHYNAGMILMRSGKPAAAMRHFHKLINLDPEDESYRRAYERAKFIRKCFQQSAGWRDLGLEISELINTIISNPGKFEQSYREYLDTVIRELSLTVFDNDQERATASLQKIQGMIRDIGMSVQRLRLSSGLTIDQLRFCIAVLMRAKKAEFKSARKEIWLVPVGEEEEMQSSSDDRVSSPVAGSRRSPTTS